MEPLKKKYGLFTAIAMVVGIVIGSGVFFKAEKVMALTGGDLPLSILAWVIGGLVMVICAYTFAIMATRYQKVNGVVDYAEVTCGKGYGYALGWFMTFIYYPAMTSVLAWLCARYFGVLLGGENAGFGMFSPNVMTLACLFLVGSYTVNALSPILAGKFQVATTIIKLIPLILTAVVGLIIGLVRGVTVQNFTTVVNEVNKTSALFSAICATCFAYEGWIIATSINAELKNSKKNLPKALVVGTLIVIVVYVLYYIGLAGGISNEQLIAEGANSANKSFQAIFGTFAGTTLTVFVVISCMGTLNGLMLGTTRGIYALAARNLGPKPELFSEVDSKTNMPTASAILGVFMTAVWLVYFYGSASEWWGLFCFDSSELPIITIYAFYIPIFIMMMVKEKDLHWFKRFVMPSLAILSCILMIVASGFNHKMANVYYLIIFAIVELIGIIVYYKKPIGNFFKKLFIKIKNSKLFKKKQKAK